MKNKKSKGFIVRKTKIISSTLVTAALLIAATVQASSLLDKSIIHAPKDGVVRIFGPGGPHTVFIKAAHAFQKETGKKVVVFFGPESKWTSDAQHSADIIFGSSEQSMTAFLENYTFVHSKDVDPLYIRPAVIVVQKGNPKNIQGFSDLLKPGTRIIVTEGKGVYNTSGTGVWEDVAGRRGSLTDVKELRKNIVSFEKGSGASFRAFKSLDADAWITWIHWPLDHSDVVDYVQLELVTTYSLGNTEIDLLRHEVKKNGILLPFTAKEFELLKYFIQYRGVPLSRDQLLEKVWGMESFITTRTVDNHVLRLRKKLEDIPDTPRFFITIYGVGYKFVG
jgi:accessory colonization factor AcfC